MNDTVQRSGLSPVSDGPGARPAAQESGEVQIIVEGHLGPEWSAWFDNLDVRCERDEDQKAITVLTGSVHDQPGLYGILDKLRDLGLELRSLTRPESPIDPISTILDDGQTDEPTDD